MCQSKTTIMGRIPAFIVLFIVSLISSASSDRDQSFTVHDFGPSGHVGPFTVNLDNGLEPGAMISAVLYADEKMHIRVHDENENLLFSFAGPGGPEGDNQLAFNSRIDGEWGEEVWAESKPWYKGSRGTFSLLYESDGYRVFVNGESVLFYPHRSSNPPSYIQFTDGKVFKVIFHTTFDFTP